MGSQVIQDQSPHSPPGGKCPCKTPPFSMRSAGSSATVCPLLCSGNRAAASEGENQQREFQGAMPTTTPGCVAFLHPAVIRVKSARVSALDGRQVTDERLGKSQFRMALGQRFSPPWVSICASESALDIMVSARALSIALRSAKRSGTRRNAALARSTASSAWGRRSSWGQRYSLFVGRIDHFFKTASPSTSSPLINNL